MSVYRTIGPLVLLSVANLDFENLESRKLKKGFLTWSFNLGRLIEDDEKITL